MSVAITNVITCTKICVRAIGNITRMRNREGNRVWEALKGDTFDITNTKISQTIHPRTFLLQYDTFPSSCVHMADSESKGFEHLIGKTL